MAAASENGDARALDLLVLAELNPDVVVDCAPGAVRFGQVEQLVNSAALTLGSSGAITASAAAAQGLRVAVAAVVGDDPAGRFVTGLLATRGVDTSPVATHTGRATGLTVVLTAPGGDRALLTFPGTMADLRAADVPDDLLRSVRHLHVSSVYLQRGLHDGLPALLGRAHAAGATTSLDPGWDPGEGWSAALPALAALNVLLPNAAEALALATALTGTTPADVPAAAAVLAKSGPAVVVKAGADGAVVAAGGTRGLVRARAVEPVDTTGAGDNFDAGFLTAWLDGLPVLTAAARGVASGSISVTGRGGTGRHASRDEAAAVAESLPITVTAEVPA